MGRELQAQAAEETTALLKKQTEKTLHYETDKWSVYLVLLLLSVGYFGKYFCTTCMYVVEELFMDDTGVGHRKMSFMFSLGYLSSMLGKITAGILSDRIGGKPVIILAMLGYVSCTMLFSIVPSGSSWSYHAFLACWVGSGFFALGLAWVAVVSVATNWIPTSMTGGLMGVVSLAPQIGDVLTRAVLGSLLASDMGWRSVLQSAAVIAVCLNVPILLLVANHPPTVSQRDNKDKIQLVQEAKPLGERLRPLLASPLLWLICIISGSLYGSRSLFLLYATDIMLIAYCKDGGSHCKSSSKSVGVVGICSMIYTLLGCFSVLIVGIAKDRLPKRFRALILVVFIVPLVCTMVLFTVYAGETSFAVTVALVGVIGFSLFGPYKVLGGAFSVDIGGKELKATACSIMGVSDNFFAMCMITLKGELQGWGSMFAVCTALSLSALVCALAVLYRDQEESQVRKDARRERRLSIGASPERRRVSMSPPGQEDYISAQRIAATKVMPSETLMSEYDEGEEEEDSMMGEEESPETPETVAGEEPGVRLDASVQRAIARRKSFIAFTSGNT
eukprot:TRINITY_DN9349_c0_g1_i1.p1 TRINITY_DN9349_c0_g1~~TRINITY_DN9349_c0_g1_i1.p1  ORF type:complete len:588 (+),score=167.67 TRINITY_DN9349_c0_g1_i1:82-1764(+)